VDTVNLMLRVSSETVITIYIYSSLFTISGRQLKHTEINRETEIRQTKDTK